MADLYVQVEVGLPRSRLVDKARTVLGMSRGQIVGSLVMLWITVMETGCHGQLDDRSDAWIEDAADWHGEPGAFARFVREHHLTDGVIDDWIAKYGALEKRREKMRTKKARQRTVPGTRGGHKGDTYSSSSSSRSALNGKNHETREGEAASLPSAPIASAEFEVFGVYAGHVEGLVRSSRKPGSVLATLKALMSGLHGKYSPEAVGRAAMEFSAAGHEFSPKHFGGFVRDAMRSGEVEHRREANRSEQQAIDREAEARRRDAEEAKRTERMVADFRATHPETYEKLRVRAEREERTEGAFRSALVHARLIGLVREALATPTDARR